MPESIFEIAQLETPDDVAAVMFELQDLPCVNQADVDITRNCLLAEYERARQPVCQ